MGIGPVPAVQALLKATGKSVKDIDLVEVSAYVNSASIYLLLILSDCL